MGCNYLSLPLMPASVTQILILSHLLSACNATVHQRRFLTTYELICYCYIASYHLCGFFIEVSYLSFDVCGHVLVLWGRIWGWRCAKQGKQVHISIPGIHITLKLGNTSWWNPTRVMSMLLALCVPDPQVRGFSTHRANEAEDTTLELYQTGNMYI